jgi:endonuclease/exonuclease/phosphatase family metal-dependent hydrolase
VADRELRLLTYNVRSLRGSREAVAAVIAACRPDVVAVQEAPRFLRWRSKRAALARLSGLVVATADRPGGLFVMTTLAVTVHGTRFALLPKSPRRHQRAVVSADVSLGGVRWTIASIHLSLDADERLRHLPQLRAALDLHDNDGDGGGGAGDAPLVVAGDVNEEPGGAVWTQLATQLQDAYATAPDGARGPAPDGARGPAPDGAGVGASGDTYPAAAPRKRIDGIFADRWVEVVSCRAVREAPGVDAGVLARASDHLPVLAVLRQ